MEEELPAAALCQQRLKPSQLVDVGPVEEHRPAWVQEILKELKSLDAAVHTLDQKLTDQTSTLKDHTRHLKALNDKIHGQTTILKDHKSQLKVLNGKINGWMPTIKDHTAQLQELNQKCIGHSITLNDHTGQLQAMNRKLDGKRAQLRGLKRKLDDHKDALTKQSDLLVGTVKHLRRHEVLIEQGRRRVGDGLQIQTERLKTITEHQFNPAPRHKKGIGLLTNRNKQQKGDT